MHECESASDWGDWAAVWAGRAATGCDRPLSPVSNKKRTRMRRTADAPSEEPELGSIVTETETGCEREREGMRTRGSRRSGSNLLRAVVADYAASCRAREGETPVAQG